MIEHIGTIVIEHKNIIFNINIVDQNSLINKILTWPINDAIY